MGGLTRSTGMPSAATRGATEGAIRSLVVLTVKRAEEKFHAPIFGYVCTSSTASTIISTLILLSCSSYHMLRKNRI